MRSGVHCPSYLAIRGWLCRQAIKENNYAYYIYSLWLIRVSIKQHDSVSSRLF